MIDFPTDLKELLHRHGQHHLLELWHGLEIHERGRLVEQLRDIDLGELADLYARREETYRLPELHRLKPLPRAEPSAVERERRRGLAREALAGGKVAFLVVAGGQGSRLGFDKPKGLFPIGPVSARTLFHIHAERLTALRRRYGAPSLPFLVMTSPATDAETRAFFHSNSHFGLPQQDIWFFQQGTMPALDLTTGRLLLEDRSSLFLSPNGHGGTLTGLVTSGFLQRLAKQGIETIYYFQVDNPLVNLGDLDFLGQHLAAEAEVSNKVIAKEAPTEKLGNFVLIDDRLGMIEYSDLSDELAHRRDESGRLFFWAGNPAIHLFNVDFLQRLADDTEAIPWHVARKRVAHFDVARGRVDPAEVNALKFERFIFDILPRAQRWTNLPIARQDEFEPLKNATGRESPATVRQALIEQAVRWLEAAGVRVPRDDTGRPIHPVEVSPLFALDAEELAAKLPTRFTLEGPRVLSS